MSNIGRNEPCPCGSGKKYKKCCLLKKDELATRQREKQSAAPRALDWLSARYPEEVAEAVHYDFFGDPDEEKMQAINELLESYENLEARRVRDQGGQPFDFGFL
jgi:hypothetical protein